MARQIQKKMYRTMQGRLIDIEKLRMSNESVPAVGNMNVNARGDVLGPGGKIVTTKEQIMKQYYETPKGRASEQTVSSATNNPVKNNEQATPVLKKINPEETVAKTTTPATKKVDTFKPKKTVETKTAEPNTSTENKTGIDAALDGIE
jgi:hypothetical protein